MGNANRVAAPARPCHAGAAGLRRRSLLALTVFAVSVCIAMMLGVAVLFESVTGPSMPSMQALPDLPDGYALGAPESGCGSGGCFLVATVTGPPDMTSDEVAEGLRDSVSGCRAYGWFDRRRLCTSVVLSGSAQVRITVMLHDFGK